MPYYTSFLILYNFVIECSICSIVLGDVFTGCEILQDNLTAKIDVIYVYKVFISKENAGISRFLLILTSHSNLILFLSSTIFVLRTILDIHVLHKFYSRSEHSVYGIIYYPSADISRIA